MTSAPNAVASTAKIMSRDNESPPSSSGGSNDDNADNNTTSCSAALVDSNDDVVIKTTAADGNTTAADKLMQSVYDKSTSSSSSSAVIIDEEKVKKAITFLRNRDIKDISPREKRNYLTTVGMSPDEIDTALDRMAATSSTSAAADVEERRHHGDYNNRNNNEGRPYYQQQQQNQYGGHPRSPGLPQNHHNNMQSTLHNQNNMDFAHNNNMGGNYREDGGDQSFFSFSSWVGGFCMSTFCLAALRWLNGGDFVLFPPAMAGNNNNMNTVGRIKQSTDETQNEQNTDAEDSNDESNNHQDEEEEEASFNSNGSGDPDLSMILNGTANHEAVHRNNQEDSSSSSFDNLVMEVKALSLAINSFREEQERANTAVVNQLGKGVTDDAMDFLRQQKPVLPKKKGSSETTVITKEDLAHIMSLIADIVHELSQVKDSLEDDKVIVAEENATTTEENEDDANKDKTDLSSKINVALEKGKEILALIQGTDDDTNSNKIDSQQIAPLATHGKSEKGSEQQEESNGTKGEETEGVDSDMSEQVDSSSAAHEESSDANLKSEDLEQALKVLSQNKADELKIGAQMLYLYCKNLSKNPTVPRYRKIYTNNNSFKSKVGNLVGAKDFLSSLGFVERTNFFEWSPSNETSSDTKSQLDFALVALDMLQKGSHNTEDDNNDSGSDTSEKKPDTETNNSK